MGRTNQPNPPIWHEGAATSARPSLTSDANADVVVVGGGITGVTTTALPLQQGGASVALLEADGAT